MIVSRKYLLSLLAQGIFLVLCNAKGAVLCLIFPLLYVLFGKYKEEPGKRLPLGVIYVTLSVAFLITASYDFTAVSTIIFLDRKGRHFNRSYPVVAADHPGYDQPATLPDMDMECSGGTDRQLPWSIRHFHEILLWEA